MALKQRRPALRQCRGKRRGASTDLTRRALPEHDCKGVHVGLFGVALVRQHFWRHPLEGAQAPRERVQIVHHSRQPKVRHAHAQRLVHQQVACQALQLFRSPVQYALVEPWR